MSHAAADYAVSMLHTLVIHYAMPLDAAAAAALLRRFARLLR